MRQIKRCDPRVRRKCPDAGFCKGVFMEGSECDSLQSKLAEQGDQRGTRLIDANKIPYHKSGFPKGDGFDSGLDWSFREDIDELPTVDAAPLVHGRWLDVQETDMYVPDMKFTITKTAETCSECNARIGFVGAKLYLFDSVCPNCGAKMDLEAAHE